jgi:hypothetical protein
VKKALINEILNLTKLQGVALEDDAIDEFASLIEKRQVCMDKIDEIINLDASVLDDEDKQILLQATEVDQKNKKEFERQFEDVKIQLRKIRDLKKRDTIYSNPYDTSVEEGVFIDKK